MQLQKYTLTDFKKVPWQNGLGVTTELFRAPYDNALGYLYRLSIADISQDGPFSIIKGAARYHMLYQGEGSELLFDSGRYKKLSQLFDNVEFSGEDSLQCKLLNGPIQALNLIYDPEHCNVKAQIVHLQNSRLIALNSHSQYLMISLDGVISIKASDVRTSLDRGELLVTRGATQCSFEGGSSFLIFEVLV